MIVDVIYFIISTFLFGIRVELHTVMLFLCIIVFQRPSFNEQLVSNAVYYFYPTSDYNNTVLHFISKSCSWWYLKYSILLILLESTGKHLSISLWDNFM